MNILKNYPITKNHCTIRTGRNGQPSPDRLINTAVQQDEDVYAGERSKYTQYVASSGLFGFLYGTSAAYILGIENSGAIAIPLLTAGASTLIPMLSIKDKYVSYNSLALSIHGKGSEVSRGLHLVSC